MYCHALTWPGASFFSFPVRGATGAYDYLTGHLFKAVSMPWAIACQMTCQMASMVEGGLEAML